MQNSNLEFVYSIDLREFHVVVKQGLGDDVQDALPLRRRQRETSRSEPNCIRINNHQRSGQGGFTVTVEKTRHLDPASVT